MDNLLGRQKQQIGHKIRYESLLKLLIVSIDGKNYIE